MMALALGLVGQPVQPYLTTGATDFVNSVQKGKEDAIKTEELKTQSQKSALDLLTAQKKQKDEQWYSDNAGALSRKVKTLDVADEDLAKMAQVNPEYHKVLQTERADAVKNFNASNLAYLGSSADKAKSAQEIIQASEAHGMTIPDQFKQSPETLMQYLKVINAGSKAFDLKNVSKDESGDIITTDITGNTTDIKPAAVKPDVLTQKDKVLQDFQERKLRAEQDRAAKELALKERELTLKPDPVQKAIEIEIGKEKVKTESTAQAARREKLANANDGLPLIDNYINALKESPQTGAGETYEKVMGYVGLGSQKQQAAMAKAKQAGEALLTFAQKQPGPSTDRDVASYRAQMGVVTDSSLPAKARIAAAEQAKTLLLKIQAKYGNYQDGGQNQQQTNQTGGWKIERVK